jgi:hypothetical protein
MKVYIGKPKSWFGPYQLAELLMFWVPKQYDEYGFEHNSDKVHKFGEWLAHGSVLKDSEKTILWKDERPNTWLYDFMLWIDKKKSKKEYIKIDKWDTWSMDRTLSPIILPMLKQLKAAKHGSPLVDDDDVPEELKSTSAPPTENKWDTDDNHHKRWDYVMDQMIFAFEHLVDDSWEDKYSSGDFDTYSEACEFDVNGKPKMYQMKYGPNHTYKCDYDGLQEEWNKVDNGLRLFGKYYRNLWD